LILILIVSVNALLPDVVVGGGQEDVQEFLEAQISLLVGVKFSYYLFGHLFKAFWRHIPT